MRTETVEYIVKKDDNLWNIVKAAGFPPKDWKKIYSAKYNAKFKRDRPNPHRIVKGDKLNLPRYGPNSYAKLSAYLNVQESVLKQYRERIKVIEKSLSFKATSQAEAKAYLSKLRKESERLRGIGETANDQCSGDWKVCLGAGMYAEKMFREARGVMKKYDKYEKLMKAQQYDKGVKAMQAMLDDLNRDAKQTEKTLGYLKKSAQAALKNPYQ